jgi:hypothetical protein
MSARSSGKLRSKSPEQTIPRQRVFRIFSRPVEVQAHHRGNGLRPSGDGENLSEREAKLSLHDDLRA